MYATNNGTTNKAPNSNSTSLFENTITVTPIKMELDGTISQAYAGTVGAAGTIKSTAASAQRRNQNAVVTSNQQAGSITLPMQTTLTNNACVTGNTAVSVTPVAVGSANTPKEKPVKTPRVPVVRKPPPTIDNFWPNILTEVNSIGQVDAKHQVLPLARIKKIMKLDENAKMIAGEAPLLFAKACEYFIQELTMRAWVHTEESRRRTLQRSDIAQAIANYDQFDFLIDIVPREEIKPSTAQKKEAAMNTATVTTVNSNAPTTSSASVPGAPQKMDTTSNTTEVLSFGTLNPELFATTSTQQLQQLTAPQHQPQQLQIIQQGAAGPQQLQYFIALPGQQPNQLVQQLQQQQQQQPAQTHLQNSLGLNIVTQQPTQQLILTAGPNGQLTATPAPTTAAQQQTALLQNLAQQQQQQQQQQIQLLQQVVTPTGELTNVPISINANQLHLLRLQMQQQQQQQQQQQAAAVAAAAQHNQQQQVIIPTQLLTAQQLLQLSGTASGTTANAAAMQHQQHQQQQQQHVTMSVSNNNGNNTTVSAPIFINSGMSGMNVQSSTQNQPISAISTDRTLAGGYR